MKLILKIILRILVNGLGLYLCIRYIPGFAFTGDIVQLLLLAVILTVLNLVLKPILKLILSPFILITLGLGVLVVNMVILYLLDYFSAALTISGIAALFFSSILVAVLNFIFHFIL